MTDTPWTPGPWEYREGDFNQPKSPPETQVGSIVEAGDIGWIIAGIEGDVQESNANARLIAAAPEMAELLEALATVQVDTPHRWASGYASATAGLVSRTHVERARALLSRIRGETDA